MQARAEAAADTQRRIVEAAMHAFSERLYDQVALEEIARRAGVTFQTVMRRFGSKEKLFAVAAATGRARVLTRRSQPPVGDLRAAVHVLIEEYEELGDMMLRFLGQEERVPAIRELTDAGRALHREWVERVFESQLRPCKGSARRVRRATLIAATDLLVWKLLRRDLSLSKGETERAVIELVRALGGTP
jgi:AcrR family transcriptional regulator